MIRATEVLAAGHWDRSKEADLIELPHDGRRHRRIAMRAANDTVFLLDLAEGAALHDGDGLRLDDGRIVRVVAASEPLAEITAGELGPIAWQLGNRHVPAQFVNGAIRFPRDAALENWLAGLGASVAHIEAAFEPQGGGAAAEAAHAHGHHHHHDHGPECGCGHDHSHDHSHHHHGHKG